MNKFYKINTLDIKNSKKGMELSIPLLVFFTLLLVASALLIFNWNSKKIEGKIGDYASLDEIYAKENEINFYIRDLMENSASKIEKGKNPRTEFINNFQKELLRYKKEGVFYVKELEQLENQLDADKIVVDNKKMSFNFKINLEKRFEDRMIVFYSYEKEFFGMRE